MLIMRKNHVSISVQFPVYFTGDHIQPSSFWKGCYIHSFESRQWNYWVDFALSLVLILQDTSKIVLYGARHLERQM